MELLFIDYYTFTIILKISFIVEIVLTNYIFLKLIYKIHQEKQTFYKINIKS